MVCECVYIEKFNDDYDDDDDEKVYEFLFEIYEKKETKPRV